MTFDFTYQSDDNVSAKVALGLSPDLGGVIVGSELGDQVSGLLDFINQKFADVPNHPDLGTADEYKNLSNITFGDPDATGKIPVTVSIKTT
ncbi:hypothetical protein ABVF11_04950 [Pediococcus argentinicus]|uniref:hypothetical protein n=1 Tax=Pediococcus argentinicus TaxID=480391 RepID=UPI00338DAA2A